jgi:hypothetical protein
VGTSATGWRSGSRSDAGACARFAYRMLGSLINWIVATNHLFNLHNLGLGIGSDGLCELNERRRLTESRA